MVKESGREEDARWRDSAIYTQTTRFMTVKVEPLYLEAQSSPAANQFVWAYRVRIENHGDAVVQLMRRHWKITDALGRVSEVRANGVVGEQPVLRPGEVYEYTSGTPLSTPSGIMMGTYQMETENGEAFDVAIPAFSLDSPFQTRRLN